MKTTTKFLTKFLFTCTLGLGVFGLSACEEPAPTSSGAGTIDTSVRGEAQSLSGKIDVKRVISPGGIEAWLVEEHSIPLLAINFGFQGGAYLDPDGKAGLANMLSGLLDEGAGDYDSQAFQSTLDENSITLYYSAARDSFNGSLFTLSAKKDLAVELLRLSLSAPRFDDEPVERIRAQIAVSQKRAASSPRHIAGELLAKEIFGNQRYARPVTGDEETLAGFTVADLDAWRKEVLTRDRLKISVVGDITQGELGALLDKVFGALPAKGKPRDLTPATLQQTGGTVIEHFANPQSTVQFAGPGLMQDDEDFFPLYVTNHILGGGGLTARLGVELREKRGLTYGIYTRLQTMDRAGLFIGSVASDNAKVAEALAITKSEIDRLRNEGVSDDELTDAKTYMTGAFVLGFDSNAKIARQLLGYQLIGFPIDYINNRNDKINAVTMADVNRTLKRLPASKDITFVVVGQPEGLE